MSWRSIAWVMARRTRGSRSSGWLWWKQVRRWLATRPPATAKRGLRSISGTWSAGMSQAKSYWPEKRPLTRLATSGTTTKRSCRIGGRPPQ
ncbi:hypothetical protein D3C83_88510 [compost metagenome]